MTGDHVSRDLDRGLKVRTPRWKRRRDRVRNIHALFERERKRSGEVESHDLALAILLTDGRR